MSFLNKAIEVEFYNPASTVGAIFYALLFLCVAWLLGRLLKFAVTRAIQRDQRGLVDRMAAPFLTQLAGLAVYVVLLPVYVQLTVRGWCTEPGVSRKIECELNEQVKKRFDRHGIEIPYPYRNVIIKEQPAAA